MEDKSLKMVIVRVTFNKRYLFKKNYTKKENLREFKALYENSLTRRSWAPIGYLARNKTWGRSHDTVHFTGGVLKG